MAEFFGLLIALITAFFVVLPVLALIRMGRVTRELEQLQRRVAELEKEAAVARTTTAGSFRGVNVGAEAAAGDVAPAATVTVGDAVPQVTQALPPPLPVSMASHPAPEADSDEPDLEQRLGGRGLLYTGVLVLLFGVGFLLKFAFDNAWINETGRVVLGLLAGVAFIAGGLRLAARDLAVFGHALAGTGLAILYLAIYAALNHYALIGPTAAFLLMALVTLAAAAIADRQQSQPLAVIAVGGGFLTPFLVGGNANAQLALFSYIALLVSGTMVLSLRHQWLGLNALSYVATFVVVLSWTGQHYRDALWMRTLLFLTLFCVLFLVILRETNRSRGVLPRVVTGLLGTAPVFYHIAAIIITAQHPPAIHIYLIALTAAGLWVTADPHRPVVRLALLFAVFIPMLGTLTLPDGLSWTVPNVVAIVAVGALHVLAVVDRSVRQEERLETAELISLQVAGLGLFALLYGALQPAFPGFRGALAAIIALGALGLWHWLKARDPLASLNAAALAFTLVTIGLAVQFDGPTVIIGWAAEGAAATWVGLRSRRHVFQFGGLVLWALAVVRLLDSFAETPANFTVLLNARSIATVFVVALGYALAWMLSRSDAPEAGRMRTALHVVITVLTLMWVTAEITSFWEVRYLDSQADLYRQMMLSLAWGVYGALLIVLGMKRRYAPIRYIGMTILALTVLKVFFYDLWALGGIYRAIGFVGFGVLLLLVSYLYQKRRLVTPPSSAPPAPSDAATPAGGEMPTPDL